jgi:eukaryotic-like serine/threonine-protein kinase
MSPEQANGKSVDRRADIWAFGCVLDEMLTARRAFQGEDVSDTLAWLLKDEPDWNALPASTPRALRKLLARCLRKNQRERWRHIGDARI